MGRQSGYLKRQKVERRTRAAVAREVFEQYMVDMMCITLNDPDIMGKDSLGATRINRVIKGLLENCNKFDTALTGDVEADFYQDKIDKNLKKIFGNDDVPPFHVRYPGLKPPK